MAAVFWFVHRDFTGVGEAIVSGYGFLYLRTQFVAWFYPHQSPMPLAYFNNTNVAILSASIVGFAFLDFLFAFQFFLVLAGSAYLLFWFFNYLRGVVSPCGKVGDLPDTTFPKRSALEKGYQGVSRQDHLRSGLSLLPWSVAVFWSVVDWEHFDLGNTIIIALALDGLLHVIEELGSKIAGWLKRDRSTLAKVCVFFLFVDFSAFDLDVSLFEAPEYTAVCMLPRFGKVVLTTTAGAYLKNKFSPKQQQLDQANAERDYYKGEYNKLINEKQDRAFSQQAQFQKQTPGKNNEIVMNSPLEEGDVFTWPDVLSGMTVAGFAALFIFFHRDKLISLSSVLVVPSVFDNPRFLIVFFILEIVLVLMYCRWVRSGWSLEDSSFGAGLLEFLGFRRANGDPATLERLRRELLLLVVFALSLELCFTLVVVLLSLNYELSSFNVFPESTLAAYTESLSGLQVCLDRLKQLPPSPERDYFRERAETLLELGRLHLKDARLYFFFIEEYNKDLEKWCANQELFFWFLTAAFSKSRKSSLAVLTSGLGGGPFSDLVFPGLMACVVLSLWPHHNPLTTLLSFYGVFYLLEYCARVFPSLARPYGSPRAAAEFGLIAFTSGYLTYMFLHGFFPV